MSEIKTEIDVLEQSMSDIIGHLDQSIAKIYKDMTIPTAWEVDDIVKMSTNLARLHAAWSTLYKLDGIRRARQS